MLSYISKTAERSTTNPKKVSTNFTFNRELMRVILIVIITMICTGELSAQNSSIIGHWRRLDVYQQESSANLQLDGDFILTDDSTFTVVGSKSQLPTDTQGWHFSGNISGKWECRKKDQLSIYVDGKKPPLILKIMKLNSTDLLFRASFKGLQLSRYKRL